MCRAVRRYMPKINIASSVVLLLFSLPALSQRSEATPKNMLNPQVVGGIQSWQQHSHPFTCVVSHAKDKGGIAFFFLSDENQSDTWMNLMGQDVKLGLISSDRPAKVKRGDRLKMTFRTNNLDVRIDWLITKTATDAAKREGYWWYRFDSKITVYQGGKILQVLEKTGECGT
jgi:hypothetical protein